MLQIGFPHDYHATVRRWIDRQKTRERNRRRAERRERRSPEAPSAEESAMSQNDLEYHTIHRPGLHRFPCPARHFRLALSDLRGRDLSAALPEIVVPDPADDEEAEGTVVLDTPGRFDHPLYLQIISD